MLLMQVYRGVQEENVSVEEKTGGRRRLEEKVNKKHKSKDD